MLVYQRVPQNGQWYHLKKTGKTQVVVMVPSLASGEMLSQFAGSTVDFSNILDNHWLVVDLPLWKIWVRQLGLLFPTGSVSKPCSPVVHIKIAGKWMFIPLKMVLIGIDPYPTEWKVIKVMFQSPPTRSILKSGWSSRIDDNFTW